MSKDLQRASRPRQRGYLLIEAMVAASVLSIILGYALSQLAAARQEASYAAHRATAVSLARAKLDELMARPHVIESGNEAKGSISGYPIFSRTWSSAATNDIYDDSAPALQSANVLHRLTVSVTYPSRNGPKTVTLTRYRRN